MNLPFRKPRPPVPPAPRPVPWPDVLASLEDGIVVIDADSVVLEITPAAEQLTGISADKAVGLGLHDLFERHNRWLTELCERTLASGVARRHAHGIMVTNRREVPVAASCAPVKDADGRSTGAVLVLHDLTLQQTLETQSRRAERLAGLGTVALGLAHEIRNPLGGIKGAAQLLRADLTDPEQVRCTDIIVREVERLDGLVEQLRTLTQPPPLAIEPVNIHRVLNDVLALQRRDPAWSDARLRVEFDPSLPAVRGDRAQLTQVFLNLVRNAVQALGGRGEIAVATRMEHTFHVRRASGRGQMLSVFIEDTGAGVPPADQAHLFAPFFTTKPSGTGLGLAVCQRIVLEHGGTIGYEDRPGGGARFRVTLPVSEDDDDRTG